jgi:hypothetical protein
MGRRIIRTQLEADNTDGTVDGFFDKLMKYIPSEIIGAWIAIKGLLKSANPVNNQTNNGLVNNANGATGDNLLWILFIVLTILTAVYIFKQTLKETSKTEKSKKSPDIIQIIISPVAFVIWVFALGEPFSSLSFYQPVYGSIALIIFSLIVPLFL